MSPRSVVPSYDFSRVTAGRCLALLPLFGVLGTARLAMGTMLRDMGHPTALVGSWFAEMDDYLASRVDQAWIGTHGGSERYGMHGLPGTYGALLEDRSGPLAKILRQIPWGALLLLIGGSPCQDLTTMGPSKGKVGLCGSRSNKF